MNIPESDNSISALIDKHHENLVETPRLHMGCSQLGHPCDRWLWLSFRWAVQTKFPGRILRLFRRGQNEEATIISDLLAIGCDVRKTSLSTQHKLDFGSHVSGSLDAIIDKGVPEAPKAKHVAEFKTHNKKSFDALIKDGVEKSKPEHFTQMQVYMHGTEIDRGLYVAICKDDDRIYTERIRYDKDMASKAIKRGQRLALADRMPEPISTDPSWYQCKFCPAHEFCHKTKTTKHVNCRTCAHSTAKENSTWRCERYDADDIPVEYQHTGCESHTLHPDLVPWQLKDGLDDWTAVYVIEGRDVANGEGDAHVFTSKELLSNPKACAYSDEFIQDVRKNMDGRITS